MTVRKSRGSHLLALAAALTLALGVVACGGSDDDGADANGSAQSTGATDTAESDSDRGYARGGTTDGGGPKGESDGGKTRTRAQSSDRGTDASPDGSGGGSDSRSQPPAKPNRKPAPGPDTSEQDRVASVVSGMYRSFSEGDAKGVCAVMSDAARRQIAANPPAGSPIDPGERSCVASLSRFLDAAATSGILERTVNASVGDVRIDGDIATATVSFGQASGKIRLQRENGDWRFGVGALQPQAGSTS